MSFAPPTELFEGFCPLECTTLRVQFAGVMGGTGVPVLLLHGYPQTHAAWHRVAPALAVHYTIVAPDLPGYGRSRLMADGIWDKREVASELVSMMKRLGHERFFVVGHDRGARVGYRLALDHPDAVIGYCAMAAVPTLDVWPAVDAEFAKDSYHWFLFLQQDGIPELLLSADPTAYLNATLARTAGSLDLFHPEALSEYRDAFSDTAVRAAMLKDYRAAYNSDREHDASDRTNGRKLLCPTLVFWAQERVVAEGVGHNAQAAFEVWRRWAKNVAGVEVPGGHLIPEQASSEVLKALLPFLNACVNGPLEG